MVKHIIEENLMIKECYSFFELDKRSLGKGANAYLGEIEDFLKRSGLCMSDYISVITQSTVSQYIIQLMSTNLSTGSINHNISSIRVFLYYCMEHEWLKHFKIKLIKAQEEQIKFCPEEDIKKLLEIKNKNDYVEMRTYVVVCFILSTGARCETILNIKKEDLDFKNHFVTYRHLKNKKVATIPLTSQIERILQGFIHSWDTGSDYLFTDVSGNQLTGTALRQSLARYSQARGIKRVSPHQLRHSFAREFIKNGGDAFILQEFLTHSSVNMTRKYVRLFSEDLQNSGFEQYIPLNVISRNKSKVKTVRRA